HPRVLLWQCGPHVRSTKGFFRVAQSQRPPEYQQIPRHAVEARNLRQLAPRLEAGRLEQADAWHVVGEGEGQQRRNAEARAEFDRMVEELPPDAAPLRRR